MMQNYPLSIFHPSVRPESSPGADLSTFQKVIFSLFLGLFGPFRARYFLKKGFHDFGSNLSKQLFQNTGLPKHVKILHFIVKKPWQNKPLVPLEEGTIWLERYWIEYYSKVLKYKNVE